MTLLTRLRQLWQRLWLAISVFRDGLPPPSRTAVVNEESTKLVDDVIARRRKPGFPCPKCKNLITVSIQDLLAKTSVVCSQCRLELNMVSWQEDDQARFALENVQAAATRVEKARTYRG
jgi:hypothetical protein